MNGSYEKQLDDGGKKISLRVSKNGVNVGRTGEYATRERAQRVQAAGSGGAAISAAIDCFERARAPK